MSHQPICYGCIFISLVQRSVLTENNVIEATIILNLLDCLKNIINGSTIYRYFYQPIPYTCTIDIVTLYT